MADVCLCERTTWRRPPPPPRQWLAPPPLRISSGRRTCWDARSAGSPENPYPRPKRQRSLFRKFSSSSARRVTKNTRTSPVPAPLLTWEVDQHPALVLHLRQVMAAVVCRVVSCAPQQVKEDPADHLHASVTVCRKRNGLKLRLSHLKSRRRVKFLLPPRHQSSRLVLCRGHF